jgi:homoserine O-acetyltransferase
MVNTQHYLLKNILGYEHIYGAIGGSMGGMQLFEWAVFYPSYIEKILPYVGTPQTTSYDLLIWNFQHELINSFHKYEIPEIELNKFLNMLTQVVGYTGEYRNEKTKREDFYKYFESLTKPPSKVFTIMNKNYQMMAMITHDVSKYFDSSLEKAAKNVKSKMLIIVNKRDLTVNSQNAEVFARYADCELMLLDNKCGHIIMSCEMERIKTAIHNFFNK